MADWSDEELRSTVHAYLSMLAKQERHETYSKAAVRRDLQDGPLKARSRPSIDYRMRNISAVLDAHGRTTLIGYLPAANVGKAVTERLWTMIREADALSITAQSTTGIKKLSKTPPPMIFFNIGWMKHYAGDAVDDPTIGAHGYLGDHSHGAEAFNFLPTAKGLFQGYRPPGGKEQVNINRLGAASTDEWVEGVTVVWIAREPGTGQTFIVGWYRNARVYRDAQDGGRDLNGERHSYSVETRVEDGRLLPTVARSFPIASSRTAPGRGFGQKPTWYGAETVNAEVWSYIASIDIGTSKPATKSKQPPKNFDPELRRKVERAAVDHAVGYYKAIYGAACEVVSVEKNAKGWDLEVHYGSAPLLVEVKGLLNAGLTCELSPNEYEKMMMEDYRSRYVVYVVNNALAKAPAVPIPSIFEHAGGASWRTKDGRELIITAKTGAVLTCS